MGLFSETLREKAMVPFENLYRIYDVRKYHRIQGDDARRKYDNIIARDSSRALSPKLIKEIEDYAHVTFGSRLYAPWLVTYAAVSRAFNPGCIPDNYVGIYMLRHLIGDWRLKMGRIYQRRVLDSELIPEILRCENGELLFPDDSPVPPDQLSALLFERGDSAYLKLAHANQGRGIIVLKRESFHRDMLPMDKDFVIQHTLQHDRDFDRFTGGPPTTIRLTTVIKNGRAETREVHMRFIRKGYTHLVKGAGASVSIDRDTGAYFPLAVIDEWTLIDRQPDTGEVYAGNTLPHLAAMKSACEALHEKVPEIAWLGFDLCPLSNGEFAIMEVNCGHADIKLSEAMHGPNYDDLGWTNLHKEHSIFENPSKAWG